MSKFGKGIIFVKPRLLHWFTHLVKKKDCKSCCVFCEFYNLCKFE